MNHLIDSLLPCDSRAGLHRRLRGHWCRPGPRAQLRHEATHGLVLSEGFDARGKHVVNVGWFVGPKPQAVDLGLDACRLELLAIPPVEPDPDAGLAYHVFPSTKDLTR
jgi:hypothetical protein